MRWLLLVILLGGCLDATPDRAPDPDPSPQPPAPRGETPPAVLAPVAMLLSFDYTDCRGVVADVPLEVATAENALPEGYAVWQDAQGAAQAQYLWVGCATFTTPATSVNDTVYGHVVVRIEAPENASDVDEHWYRLRMLAQEDILQTVWEAAAYDVYAGAFSSGSSTPLPVPERMTALGDYRARLVGEIGPETWAGTVAYYTQTPGGRLEWTGTVDAQRSPGAGTLDVPAGDPFSGQVPPTVQPHHVTGSFVANDLWLRP